MKRYLYLFFVIALLATVGCGTDKQHSDFKYSCTIQLEDEQLEKFEAPVKPSYDFGNLKLLAKVSNIIFNEAGRQKNYDVQFYTSTAELLVVQVYGLADEATIDKATCAVLAFKDYIFPKNTIFLFYRTPKNAPEQELVVGLQRK